MKNAIMISIRPEWVAKILNGEKTIEIRKTAPKRGLPVDVYIYCTKGKDLRFHQLEAPFFPCPGDAIHCFWEKFKYAYFDEDELDEAKEEFLAGFDARNETDDHINGKVVAKFRLNEIYEYRIKNPNTWSDSSFGKTAKTFMGLRLNELQLYAAGKPFFGWIISDLKIFDKPKDLSEFGLKRAPQSWQYVEERK